VLPDAEFDFVGHADTGLLQRQQDLAAMMRFVRDEIAEQDDAGTVLDAFAFFDDAREALFHCLARRPERCYQVFTAW
jgi:hypothetical protein